MAYARGLARFPIGWEHPIKRKALKINRLEHVLIRKVYQLFWNMFYGGYEWAASDWRVGDSRQS